MGAKRKRRELAEVLFSRTQARVLGLLFGQPERSFYANEVVRSAKGGVGAVQRELEALASVALISVSRRGNQKHYQANRHSPLFRELCGIVAIALAPPRSRRAPARAKPALRSAPAEIAARPAQKLHIARGRMIELCREYGVKRLGLLGEAARGELGPESAVDLRVEFQSATAPRDHSELPRRLSEIFGGRRVEVARFEQDDAIPAEIRWLYET